MDEERQPFNKVALAAFISASIGACAVIGVAFGALPMLDVDQKILAIIIILSSVFALILGIIGLVQAHRHNQSGLLFALLSTLFGFCGVILIIAVLFFLPRIAPLLR